MTVLILPAGISLASPVTNGRTGLLVPLYTPAGDASWSALIQVKESYPSVSFVAIINPKSGPGSSSNSTFVAGIKSLQAAGISVVGYISTNYASTSVSIVENDTLNYHGWYNVSGIFFDQMSNSQTEVSYYSTVSNYAHSLGLALTIGNRGTSVPASFIGTMNILGIYENAGNPSVSTISNAAMGYDRNNFAMIAYNVDAPTQSYLESVAPYVSYVYFTDENMPNPFAGLTSYLNTLASELSSIDGPDTSINNLAGAITIGNNDSTLTFNTGVSHITLSLNLGHANTWTATQTFQNIAFSADSIYSIGTAANRAANVISNLFSVYHLSGDANPTAQLGDGFLKFGAGGASALDVELLENDVYGAGNTGFIMQPATGNLAMRTDFLPSGSSTISQFRFVDTSNVFGPGSALTILAYGAAGYINIDSGAINGGSVLPLFFSVNGNKMFELNTDYTNSFFGSSGSTLVFKTSTTGIGNTQGFQSVIAQALTNGRTTTTVSLPVPEPDTAYAVSCTSNANLGAVWVTGKATNQFVINTNTPAGPSSTADCIITHQ